MENRFSYINLLRNLIRSYIFLPNAVYWPKQDAILAVERIYFNLNLPMHLILLRGQRRIERQTCMSMSSSTSNMNANVKLNDQHAVRRRIKRQAWTSMSI